MSAELLNGSTNPQGKRIRKANKTNKKKSTSTPSGTCFVLMPFKEPFDSYYSLIIGPAVEEVGLKPLRGDSLFMPSPIMADIWRMIQDAKILVAELTGKNANVFYELGLAHALGKPVILISETMDDVPFDLQPLRVIVYNKTHPAWGEKLKKALVAFMKETSADVAKAVPPMFRKAVKSQAPEDSDLSIRLAELERRVAGLPIPMEPRSNIDLEGIDWLSVEKYLRDPEGLSKGGFFKDREHAIAWSMNALVHDTPLSVQQQIKERHPLPSEEIARILYAAEHPPLDARGVLRRALNRLKRAPHAIPASPF